ncbi:MAG: IPT/TIG domain-containing protein [bacterium]|nr:IPT/TIG domain-containing protein [bacterium]
MPPVFVRAQANPVLQTVSPPIAIVGQEINITGSNLPYYGSLQFQSNTTAANKYFTSPDGRNSAVPVPNFIAPGNYQISVVEGSDNISNSLSLRIEPLQSQSLPPATPLPPANPSSPPAPTLTPTPSPTAPSVISNVSPPEVDINDTLTITGSGFTGYGRVIFSNNQQEAYKQYYTASDNEIKTPVPGILPPGNYSLHIINISGQPSNSVTVIVKKQPAPSPTLPPYLPPDCFLGFWCPAPDKTYLALGDSVAAGYIALRGYPIRYRSHLATFFDTNIRLDNQSRSGSDSADLLHTLQNNTSLRDKVASAYVITWNIGGNDLRKARELYKNKKCGGEDNQQCLRETVTTFNNNWDKIVATISQLRGLDAISFTMDIYNPFVAADSRIDTWPNDAGNDFIILNQYLNFVNHHINTSNPGRILVAQVHRAFNGSSGAIDPDQQNLISFDGYHPNNNGHEVIKEELAQLGPHYALDAKNN